MAVSEEEHDFMNDDGFLSAVAVLGGKPLQNHHRADLKKLLYQFHVLDLQCAVGIKSQQ